MKSYSEFRKIVGLKGAEIEKLTGYTRQGIHHVFNMSKPAEKFLTCINYVMEKQIVLEMEKHEKRIRELRELQESFQDIS